MRQLTSILLTFFILNSALAQIEYHGQTTKQGLASESNFTLGEPSLTQADSFCECEDFAQGANENWPHVLTAVTADDGNMGEAQSFQIIVTSLPDEGVNFRVAKTVANGNWYFAPAEPLELGTNSKTVAAVAFARAVKFQFSDCNVAYTVFTLNEEGVCGSAPLVLGCTDENACNYNPDATEDDETCFSIGDECDDEDAGTTNDLIDENCECAGEEEVSGVNGFDVDVQIGPNPTEHSVLVRASAAIEEIAVVNIAGSLVFQEYPRQESFQVDLTGSAGGVYFMKCLIDGQWISQKIILSKE